MAPLGSPDMARLQVMASAILVDADPVGCGVAESGRDDYAAERGGKGVAEVEGADAPTADLVDAVQPGGLFHTLPTALDKPLLFIAGGIPVHRDGRPIGAIGVGGGTPDQDHGFATMAVEALV